MIFLVVSSFFFTSLWVARVESSSPALVFDRFRCHGKTLATFFTLMLIAYALRACFFPLKFFSLFWRKL